MFPRRRAACGLTKGIPRRRAGVAAQRGLEAAGSVVPRHVGRFHAGVDRGGNTPLSRSGAGPLAWTEIAACCGIAEVLGVLVLNGPTNGKSFHVIAHPPTTGAALPGGLGASHGYSGTSSTLRPGLGDPTARRIRGCVSPH